MLGDVGDGPRADRYDRQARLQLEEDLLDGVLVNVGLILAAGRRGRAAERDGDQRGARLLRSSSPRRIGVASCTTSTGPGPCARSSRIGGQSQEGVGPDLDPVQLEALEAGGLGQRFAACPAARPCRPGRSGTRGRLRGRGHRLPPHGGYPPRSRRPRRPPVTRRSRRDTSPAPALHQLGPELGQALQRGLDAGEQRPVDLLEQAVVQLLGLVVGPSSPPVCRPGGLRPNSRARHLRPSMPTRPAGSMWFTGVNTRCRPDRHPFGVEAARSRTADDPRRLRWREAWRAESKQMP